MSDLTRILSDYLFRPEVFWPEDGYFHSRNRQKIGAARKKLKLKNDRDLETVVLPWLEKRARTGAASLFILSTGASGCHFFGSLLSSRADYQMIGEVYFPPDLLEQAEGLDVEERHILLDAVSALPTAKARRDADVIPVNIMHLRPDSPIQLLREELPGSRFVGLIRNPYDIAISRAFRKQAYRKATNPNRSDTEYAAMQARVVRRFFSMFGAEEWDRVVRYESLIEAPLQIANDMLDALGLPSGGLSLAQLEMDNHNRAARPDILPDIGDIFHDILSEKAALWDYAPSRDLPFQRGAEPGIWRPMQAELLRQANIRLARKKGRLKVLSSQSPFDPEALDFDALDAVTDGKTDTWKLYFWALGWLYLLPYLEEPGRDQAWIFGQLLDRTAAWCRDRDQAPDRFWDDHATAYRLATIIDLAQRLSDSEEIRSRADQLARIVPAHLEMLQSFMASDKWAGNNHGVFHAMSAINAALHSEHAASHAVPPAEMVERGLAHLDHVLRSIVDPGTGISREQSFQYHIWGLNLLKDVERFLAENDLAISFAIAACREKMLAFGAYMMVGKETVPAIGDTNYRNGYRIQNLRKLARPIDLGDVPPPSELGVGGRQGAFSGLVGPDQGFTVMRRHKAKAPGRDSLAVFTHFPRRQSHGHFDALSVWFTRRGVPALIESGGPYNYGVPERFHYFIAPVAHNCLLVDDHVYKGGAQLLRQARDKRGCVAHAATLDNHGIRHDRIVHLSDPDRIAIYDRIESIDRAEHDLRLLFHLPPETPVEMSPASDGASIALEEDTRLRIAESGDRLSVKLADGDPPGWVTRRQGNKEAAPVIVAQARCAALTVVTIMDSRGGGEADGTDDPLFAGDLDMETGGLFDVEETAEQLLDRVSALRHL
ncbi:heparinase II/III family protein [Parasphingopyxis sp.]|uniref:heparinase II/III domain-containing protein n=1 Tax=Parasphingopyxis sp. TaxID=1920299 RepID=UPI00261C45C9|nr:heparinase II/III family protein [Parasphingopyxis sp.]